MDSRGRRLQYSGGRNAVATSSSGYKKLLRTLQACSGNVTAMTEVARDFLGAGLLAGATVKPDTLSTTIEKTVEFFGKVENKNPNNEFITVPRRPQPIKPPAASSGEDQTQQQTEGYYDDHHQTGFNDPFLKLANEMFVAYTNSEPYWSRGMPMSVEGNNSAQSYYGREGMPPSMVMSMEEYNSQPYRGEKGVQPGMAEAMFRRRDHGSNGYYLSPEEGWAASTGGSYAGGADARSFSYGGDYHHRSTPYTTPCNHYTANNGPTMVCGFCLDSACRCYYTQQHAGFMHFQPSPLLPSKHAVANPKTPSPSTTASSTAAAPGGLDQRSLALSTTAITDEEAQCDYGMCYACSKCVNPRPASECHTGPFTCPGQHGLTSWVILAREYTCHFCGGMIAGGFPVLSCSLCQVYACPSCVWMHPSTSC